jgi:hypothetical protein
VSHAVPGQSRESVPGGNGKARTMKHITGKALGIATCVGLLATGLALLAG